MGINYFLYFSIIISIFVLSSKVQVKNNKVVSKNQSNFEFDNFNKFTIDTKNVSSIISADKYIKFQNKGKMLKANITSRVEGKEIIDTLIADTIIKKDSMLFLDGNIKYNRDSYIELNTNYLQYNMKTLVFIGNGKFDGKYQGNKIKGENLYFDTVNNIFKAQNTEFELSIK